MVDENDRQKWSTDEETERDRPCVCVREREREVDREIKERDGQTNKRERVTQTI
jgi:hypothetical protein